MRLPARWREGRSKVASSSLVSAQRPLETSKVKVMGTPCLRIMQARAVLRLCQLIELMQFWQSNMASCLLSILTSTLALTWRGEPCWWSGPQQKRLFLEEWLWRSKKNSARCRCRLSRCTSPTSPFTSGQRKQPTSSNLRLRSLPLKLVLQLPAVTPSGFIMGRTQKLQAASSLCAAGVGARRARRKPSSMCEELVSPGWMRAVITTLLFFCPQPLETLISGSSSPLKLSQAVDTLTQGWLLMSSTKRRRSEQVYGMEQAKQTSMFSLRKSNLNCSWWAVLPLPYLQSRSTNWVSQQRLCDQGVASEPASTTWQQGCMPFPQRFLRLTMLQRLSCTGPSCRPLLTRKQNQFVCPLVFVSLRRKQSYSPLRTRTAKSKLPLSKLESKASSCGLLQEGRLMAGCARPTEETASAMRPSLTSQRSRYFQRQAKRWCSCTELMLRWPRQTTWQSCWRASSSATCWVPLLWQVSGMGQEGSLGIQPVTMSGSSEYCWRRMLRPSFSRQPTSCEGASLLSERLSQPSSSFSIFLYYCERTCDQRFIFMILLCSCFTASSQLCRLPRPRQPSFTSPTRFSLFFSGCSPSLLNWMAVLLRLAIDSRSKKGGTASFYAAFGRAFLQRLMLGLKEKSSFLDFYSSSSLRLTFSLCSFCNSHNWFLVATSKVEPDACPDGFFDSTGLSFWSSSDFLSFSEFLSLREWLMLLSLEFLQFFCSLRAPLVLPAGLSLFSWRLSLSRVGLKVHSSESFSSRMVEQRFLANSSLLSYSVLHIWLKRWSRECASSLHSVLTRLPASWPASFIECEEVEADWFFRGIIGLSTRLLELFLFFEAESRREPLVLRSAVSLALPSFCCRIWRILVELLEAWRWWGGGRRQSASLSLKSESSSQQRSSISEKLWWWLRLWLRSWLNSAGPASCAKRLSQSISCGQHWPLVCCACLRASLLCSSSRYSSALGEQLGVGRAGRIRYGKAQYIYFNEFLSQYSPISAARTPLRHRQPERPAAIRMRVAAALRLQQQRKQIIGHSLSLIRRYSSMFSRGSQELREKEDSCSRDSLAELSDCVWEASGWQSRSLQLLLRRRGARSSGLWVSVGGRESSC